MNPVPDEAAAVAYNRDLWACVCCGANVASRPRSALRRSPDGGDSAANLLTFLGDGRRLRDPSDHRARVDSGRDPMDEAMGYRVAAGVDPALVPVMLATPDGPLIVWLADDGSYSPAAPEGAEAA